MFIKENISYEELMERTLHLVLGDNKDVYLTGAPPVVVVYFTKEAKRHMIKEIVLSKNLIMDDELRNHPVEYLNIDQIITPHNILVHLKEIDA